MTVGYEVKSELVPDTNPRQFRSAGREHYNVRVFLVPSAPDTLDDVKWVEYELHPTFKQRIQRVEDPTRGFELRIWTYGYFAVTARVCKKDGSYVKATGRVQW